MIAVDTNVLLRYLLSDDEKQSEQANKLINGVDQVLVTDVVLVEAIWTLKGKRYQVNKEDIVCLINALFEEPNIRFEDGLAVWGALRDFRDALEVKVNGKLKCADFSDALIVNKAKQHAKKSEELLSGVYTFDVAAQEISGTKIP